ncbi:2-hydroxyacyl-CoA dehydratase family protein [Dehalobacter sp. DCM]|uniref:2-hydroxyacyl-CoA dehydratase subunit D n=1 Tax=Dehalobacter sp. DCM TaxID=2907827 RepID=UPI0030813420|nr:2-hydroxyacyl-CoA dehydratase family protein [Dehalobacter sp. DCM]
MDAFTRLEKHAKERPAELLKMKKAGQKFVGYVPEGFLPEELVYASGAIPIGLAKGGDAETLMESLKYVPRFICTWCRSQIGYKMSGDLLYQVPHLMVVPATDCNARSIGDLWNYWTDTPAFLYGVPHNKQPEAVDYFSLGLNKLKTKLEELTGNKITDEKISDAVVKQNQIRTLLKDISDLRKKPGKPVISSFDYVRLHHYSFCADQDFLIDCLTEIYNDLKNKESEQVDCIRLFFTGGTLAHGDYRVYELLDQIGGEIVYEDFAGCLRPYENNVKLDGTDPLAALTDAYFTQRMDPAWNRPSNHRVYPMIDNIKAFGAQAVIWYQLLYREAYDMQAFFFDKIIEKETGVPMLKIESDYDASEKGNVKTRLESLIEMVQGG